MDDVLSKFEIGKTIRTDRPCVEVRRKLKESLDQFRMHGVGMPAYGQLAVIKDVGTHIFGNLHMRVRLESDIGQYIAGIPQMHRVQMFKPEQMPRLVCDKASQFFSIFIRRTGLRGDARAED